MDKKEIAEKICKDLSTLYNWEKKNPELYKAVFEYYNKDNAEIQFKNLIELFKKLTEKEQKFYLLDMETRILKRELEKEQ